ncbi:MAG: hypothetical protein ACLFQY_17320, partial [Desulfococcaceae bacterium]
GGSSNTVGCPGPWCDTRELVVWSLGNLQPGGGVKVNMPARVISGAEDGALIRLEAEVRVNGIQQVQVSKTTLVKSNPFFELTLDEDFDPVKTNGFLEYTLTYGNVGTTSSDTQLVFPVPADTNFVSATGGGIEEAGEIVWNIGSLANGEGGKRRVVVQVNAEEGDVIEVDSARITGRDSSYNVYQVLTGRTARVENDERPILAMDVNPVPVRPGEQLDIDLTVTNSGSTFLSNVELILRYPEHLTDLDDTMITTGGSSNTVGCPGPWCDTRELVVWSLGGLPSGGEVTVKMPPKVYSGTADGTPIQFEAEVRVDGIQQAFVSKTAFVGEVFDKPADDVPGDVDNSGEVDLKDAILALQIVAGLQPNVSINTNADIDDDRIGLTEAIFSLQKTAYPIRQ